MQIHRFTSSKSCPTLCWLEHTKIMDRYYSLEVVSINLSILLHFWNRNNMQSVYKEIKINMYGKGWGLMFFYDLIVS